MKDYTITVNRIGYAQAQIKLQAESREEAERKAIEQAGDRDFSEHDSRYEVENVEEGA